MQRYFVKGKDSQNNFIFEDSDLHHIKNVMRFNIGDKIEVVYDKKINICTITNINPILLKIDECYEDNNELPINLSIAIGLVSEQKFDLILQKLTELGVNKIIPVEMERSVAKIDKNKILKKKERWQKICKEASEQSHRVMVPEVEDVVTIDKLSQKEYDIKLICSLSNDTKPLGFYLKDDLKSILFLIGPEGGISPNEEDRLSKNGFLKATLAKRIFRVETAAMYVASIVNYVYKG